MFRVSGQKVRLRDQSPVHFPTEKRAEPIVQQLVFGLCQVGIVIEYFLRCPAGALEDFSVVCKIGDLQKQPVAALLRPFKVARATQFKVFFGNLETVVCPNHDFESLACLVTQLVR